MAASGYLERGIRSFLDGKTVEAERLLLRAIEHAPRAGDALHLLGLIALQDGRVRAAIDWLGRAVDAAPANPVFRGNLGSAYRAAGELPAAEAAYRAALDRKADYEPALGNLALVLLEQERAAEALAVFERAIAADATSAEAQFGRGNALAALGRHGEAALTFRAALALRRDYLEAANNLANALAVEGLLDAALDTIDQACRGARVPAALHANRGRLLALAGRDGAAIVAYRSALALDRALVEAHTGLAAALARSGQPDAAQRSFEQAIVLADGRAQAHADLAVLHEAMGNTAAARDSAGRALTRDTANATALKVLAALDRDAGDLVAARDRLAAIAARDAGAAFELGQVHDRLGEYDAALAAFALGHRLDRADPAHRRFRLDAYREEIGRQRAFFTSNRVAAWSTTAPVDGLAEPIFFAGFPRSGTTLMEQILGSHPAVVAAEEMPLLHAVRQAVERRGGGYPAALEALTAAEVTALRRTYWAAVRRHIGVVPAGRTLLDKLPLHLVHLGLVCRVFPGARVVVALRDPRDVVLSCYMQRFAANEAMVHFHNLQTAAALYADVMGLWLEQRQTLGLAYCEYRYEDLVVDAEATARRVVEFLGLPWRDSLLDPSGRGKGSLTPSYRDVRQPIYGRAVARWRRYESALQPVLPLLTPFVAAFGYGS
ncbi:MAG: sulfotransferase family protein [Alphaproteobacteria bacterium]|nr:sulfotransferase family protein [Alphaproteobacteria bacterium]